MSSEQLTRASVEEAHKLIKPFIHETPVLTSKTLDKIASTPRTPEELKGTEWEGREPAKPVLRLHFKCENFQKIGAFKARGAFHAIEKLKQKPGWEEGGSERAKGVITHSSGNHASALALAATTSSIPAHIIMPTISSPLKIAATKSHHPTLVQVHYSGSTSTEREALTAEVQARTGAALIPPYDHPDIICGQGTAALELVSQVGSGSGPRQLNAIITPCGGGGLLAGTALACSPSFSPSSESSSSPSSAPKILVFGSEPSHQGADDASRGFRSGSRIPAVSSLTIADGLRTPLGKLNWEVIYERRLVADIYPVTEDQIRSALRLVMERMKLVVEPSAVVPLAVALYNEEFRRLVEREGGAKGWDLGIIFSGGNVSVEGLSKIFLSE